MCSAKKRALQGQRAKERAKESTLQRSVPALWKEACSAKKRALQRSVLCKEACSAKKRALQRSVLCKGACSANPEADWPFRAPDCPSCSPQNKNRQRTDPFPLHSPEACLQSVLCKEVFSAKKRALQRTACCKGARKGVQRRVLCKGECSAKERALQRPGSCPPWHPRPYEKAILPGHSAGPGRMRGKKLGP